MTRPYSLLITFLTLLCLGFNSLAQVVATEQPTISVMTYNVNYAMSRPTETANILKNSTADIIFLQETHHQWDVFLTPRLSSIYPHIKFIDGPGAGGMAVLSKYPFETKAKTKAARGWFEQWLVQVESPQGPLQVYNLHLKPGLNERGKIGCMGSAWFRSLNIHKEELAECLDHTDADIPLIILGDLNENDRNRGCKWLRKRGYCDALSLSSKKENTWEWPLGAITLKGRYDHLFYSSKIRCHSTDIKHIGASDHFPVIATFSL
jgi:endonuclease/exonuclease/phosphatase (EEP) superfamily protein YafD